MFLCCNFIYMLKWWYQRPATATRIPTPTKGPTVQSSPHSIDLCHLWKKLLNYTIVTLFTLWWQVNQPCNRLWPMCIPKRKKCPRQRRPSWEGKSKTMKKQWWDPPNLTRKLPHQPCYPPLGIISIMIHCATRDIAGSWLSSLWRIHSLII